MRRFGGLLLGLALAAATGGAADAGSRGLSVVLRADDRPGAAAAGDVRLYGASYALVIGIDAYDRGWPRLSNAVKDARLVARALERQGFAVETVENPKGTELERRLREFFVVKGGDRDARLFVWFAGHGYSEGGEGYLVPTDAPRPDDRAGFKLGALPMRRFGEYVRQAESKHAFAVFDACFAGTVFDAQRSLPPAAITRATTLPVRQFLTSGDADQEVSDDGTFRELFLRALSGEEKADANSDGYLTASEMGLFLADRLTNLTRQRQTPRYGKLRDKDFDRGDFVFALARPEGDPVPAGGDRNADVVFWESIKDSGNAALFEAYLARFPAGTFAPIAKVRLEELKGGTRVASLPPSAAAANEAFPRTMVANRSANVRAEPSTDARILRGLATGEPVRVVARAGTWWRVEYEDTVTDGDDHPSGIVSEVLVKDGDPVRALQTIARVAADDGAGDINVIEADVRRGVAEVKEAQTRFDRASKLAAAGVGTRAEADQAAAALAQAKTVHAFLEDTLAGARANAHPVWVRNEGVIDRVVVKPGTRVNRYDWSVFIRTPVTGYVHGPLLAPADLPGAVEPKRLTVTVREPLPLRRDPRADAPLIRSLDIGERVTVLDRVPGTLWHKVRRADGTVGFLEGEVSGGESGR